MTEPLSRAISAYEHAAAILDARAVNHEALLLRDPGHQMAADELRSAAATMRLCADSLRPRTDLTAAIKEAVSSDD